MKKLMIVFGFLIPLCSIVVVLPGHSQPKIPREDIPSKIPAVVRDKIEGLYSQDPRERTLAAVSLGEMGANASAAIPFLLGLLDDNAHLVSGKYVKDLGYKLTTPAKEATFALKEITGQDFGEDHLKWQKWWDQNKEQFLKRR